MHKTSSVKLSAEQRAGKQAILDTWLANPAKVKQYRAGRYLKSLGARIEAHAPRNAFAYPDAVTATVEADTNAPAGSVVVYSPHDENPREEDGVRYDYFVLPAGTEIKPWETVVHQSFNTVEAA